MSSYGIWFESGTHELLKVRGGEMKKERSRFVVMDINFKVDSDLRVCYRAWTDIVDGTQAHGNETDYLSGLSLYGISA